ncbi:hypothetical protein [Methylovirgula sp. HY1]|uniref:lipase family protein n=1 Tax=Methylovirgula sp. HY1 TaxID=2822761 RepID=UPI001C5AD408|nr:hypothetical protein [Methylovirgula sp. HY1]QXX74217.1 hypothetical protein MHY1_01027 [Methylovirgula sp. HY1]
MSEIAIPSDAEIAALVIGLYAYPGYAPVAWDHLEQPEQDDGICWSLKRVGQIDVVVLRGSMTPQDWFRDLDALADPFPSKLHRIEDWLHYVGFALDAIPTRHAFLGPVHPGFLAGMEDAWAAMLPMLGANVVVAGHSLGAARSAILTGLMVHDGHPPLACVSFGQPRPGFPALAELIAGVPQRSYQNGTTDRVLVDMITEVPLAIGAEDYVHPRPLIPVCEPPSTASITARGIFAWHGMALYLRAVERLAGVAPRAATADALDA